MFCNVWYRFHFLVIGLAALVFVNPQKIELTSGTVMGKNAFLPIHGNFLLAIYFGEAVYTQKVASQWETAICLLVKRPVQPHLFHEGRKQATTKFSFSLRTWIWFLEIQL